MNHEQKDLLIEELLTGPCWVIDRLPEQAPPERAQEFFQVEELLLGEREQRAFAEKITRICLKLWCYFDVAVHWKTWWEDPAPAELPDLIRRVVVEKEGVVNLLLDEAALVSIEGDALHATVYSSDERTERLLYTLAWSEGLFWRRGV